jgi:hypothetical protein
VMLAVSHPQILALPKLAKLTKGIHYNFLAQGKVTVISLGNLRHPIPLVL